MTLFEQGTGHPSPRRAPEAPRRRRGSVRAVVLAVVAGILLLVVTVVGPERVSIALEDLITGGPPTPEASIVAAADRAGFTEQGRDLLYRQQPKIASQAEVAEMCGGSGSAPGILTMGCYSSNGFILIAEPVDQRAADYTVTVLSHEMLHAAYDGFDGGERAEIDALVHTAYAAIAPGDPLHELVEASVDGHSSSYPTELFAYLGTQVMPAGGFDAELEAVYSRYFTDRAALVGIYSSYLSG